MANEYNDLEQLVNDVTNIDTARMTLRWALERLNSIEKEKAELKKNLTLTDDAKKGLELKVQSLEDTFKSRGKSLEEKEGFYTKLEATMALLGDGKLDIQQLLKKEARLDHLRLELENEYQDKFEELDKNQNSVIERWNQRLLDVEGQYAKRMSEAQVRYDSLRQELEADYQARLGSLDSSYQRKEKELTERIKALETSVKIGEAGLEGRRKELETDFLGKKNEIEANYLKLKSLLESGFQARIHSVENEHCAQVKSLERTWNAERERLMAEQHARDEQFKKSQEEMARLEAQLSAQQEHHHLELIDIISRKEEAFRAKVEDLEKEKAVYETAVEKLRLQLESKEKDWIVQKEQVYAEFTRRCADMSASVKERAGALERDYFDRKNELESALASAKEQIEKDASGRIAIEHRALEEEKARLAEDNRNKGSELVRVNASIKELETTLTESREEHHRELMEKIRANEESFRDKLSEFETEKEEYKITIARLVGEAGLKDARLLEETKHLQNEFAAKYAALEAELSARDVKTKADYEVRISALVSSFEEKEKIWVLEREKLGNELAAISRDAQTLAAERVEKIKAAYEARKAELETQLEEKFAVRAAALEFEKTRVNGELTSVREELNKMAGRAKELENDLSGDRAAHHVELMERLAEKEAALKAQAADFDKELALKDEQAAKYSREFSAKETRWVEEKESLSSDFAARFQLLEKGLSERESVLENQYQLKTVELNKNSVEVRALLEADFKQRLAVEKQAFEDAKAALTEENRLKERQLSETRAQAAERVEKIKTAYESWKTELKKQFDEELSSAVGALAFEKARMVADLKTASVEYTKLTDQYKGLEAAIASDRAAHHAELMERLAEKEAALKEQAGKFAGEKDGLLAAFKAKEFFWNNEKEKFENLLVQISAGAEREIKDRAGRMAAEYENKKVEIEKNAVKICELAEKNYVSQLATERDGFEKENTRLTEEGARKEARLSDAYERLKGVEKRMGELKDSHYMELSVKMKEKDEVLAEKTSAIEADYNARLEKTIARTAEDLKKANKEIEALSSAVSAGEGEIERLNLEMAERARESSEALRHAEEEALAKKSAGLETAYKKRKERLEAEAAALKEDLEKDYRKRVEEMAGSYALKVRQADFENEALKNTAAKMGEEAAASQSKANAYFNEIMEKARGYQEEIIKLKEAHVSELNFKITDAVSKATQLLQEKLHFTAEELRDLQQYNKEELLTIEGTFRKEKERLMEELGRRQNYIEVADLRMREMENELMNSRHNSAANFLGQIADQDDKFKVLISDYETRQDKLETETAGRIEEIRRAAEAKLKDMEEMLKAKEKLVQEGGVFWRQKQAELDAQNSELNMKMHRFNEELFAQKQELSGKEKQLHEYRLGLEKDNAARMSEIEKLKVELTRAIMDYKSRK